MEPVSTDNWEQAKQEIRDRFDELQNEGEGKWRSRYIISTERDISITTVYQALADIAGPRIGLTNDEWVDLLVDAYENGSIDEWELHQDEEGRPQDLMMAVMTSPFLILRHPGWMRVGPDNKWVPNERGMIIAAPNAQSPDDEKVWPEILRRVKEKLPPLLPITQKDEIEKNREKRMQASLERGYQD